MVLADDEDFGMAPSLDASDHQDDITCFGLGIPINLHLPLLQGGGHIQMMMMMMMMMITIVDNSNNME